MNSNKEITRERIEDAIATLARLDELHPDDKDLLILDRLEAALVELEKAAASSREERFSRYRKARLCQKAARSTARPVA